MTESRALTRRTASLAGAALLLLLGRALAAQEGGGPLALSRPDCVATTRRTAPENLEGVTIGSVSVETDAPVTLPFAGEWLASLRRTTEASVVRRQLLFAPGERVDTARIAETLRRLRDQHLYADVTLMAAQCIGSDAVNLTVLTRDDWTLRPIARIVPPSTVSLGAEDGNLLGTGRTISATTEQWRRGHGGSFGVSDPWMFGRNIAGSFHFADVAGSHLLRASVRHHELSDADPWRLDAALNRQSFAQNQPLDRPLGTLYSAIQLGHLVGSAERSLTVPYAGVELDHADVIRMFGRNRTNPQIDRRRFAAVDLGVARRAAQFDTVSWFANGRGFLDIPLGIEGDGLVAPGGDAAQHAAAARYDLWLGRIWLPSRGSLITMDAWTEGFFGAVRANHIDRLAMTAYADASHGFWGTRLLFEQLQQLDPDERMLSLANITTDPTFGVVPRVLRLADRALALSMERSLHLRPIGRASMLDGALYTAGSMRWDVPNAGGERFAVAVVGARLRVLSANGAIASSRVDVGVPAAATRGVVHRPVLTVSLSPMFGGARQRDGRRREQVSAIGQ